MGKRMLSAAQAAAALGISEKQFSIFSKRDWFPRGKKIGKRIFYNDPPTAQRKAIIENVRQRKPIDEEPVGVKHGGFQASSENHVKGVKGNGKSIRQKKPIDRNARDNRLVGEADAFNSRHVPGRRKHHGGVGAADEGRTTQDSKDAEPPQFKDDDPSIIALESQTGSAVSISRSILNLASRDLARRFKKGNVGATQLDALNKTLARLVAVEADALKTAERMGLLMHREAVERVVGVLADRFIRAFGRLEAEIATEALLWRQMRDTPADQFRRTVREFVQKHAREIRAMEAAEIEAITKKES